MGRDATKTLGGWIVVLGHLIVLSWAALAGNLPPEQRRAIAWTLTPVLTVYFVGLVKWISSDPDSIEGRNAADLRILLTSVLVPSILLLTALYLIVSYPGSLADTTDTLQLWIAGIEVAMAVTVGLVVDDLIPVNRSFNIDHRTTRPAVAIVARHGVA